MNPPDPPLRRRRGRPQGFPFGEPTIPVRIPKSRVADILLWRERLKLRTGSVRILGAADPAPPPRALPFFESPRPHAGFPSPAADHVEGTLDLNDLLVTNPPATFYARMEGYSFTDVGILEGDILVVDRSIEPRPGKIVVASVDGEILVKCLDRQKGELVLCAKNAAHPEFIPIRLSQVQDCIIWGVVTGVVRQL